MSQARATGVFRLILLLMLWVCCTAVRAQSTRPAAGLFGDQGDGTFVNPIRPGDFSDIDAIRVGEDFYAISSTLHVSPGMAVMHSKDLVNWRIISHGVQDVAAIVPNMRWDRMNAYGRGVWAGAIRHHDGKFWIYFGTPDEGIFVTTATDPAGPWEPPHAVWSVKGWDDCCPFWDEDGQGYLVLTNFATDPKNGKSYNIHLMKMTPDNRSLVSESDQIIYQSRGSEASKLFKHNGIYYHYFSEVKTEGRVPMMNRSKSLAGPWETRQIGHVNKAVDKEPNQGGLIELANGQWWFLTHQGSGDWEGRALALLPVTWIDGWPIIGNVGADGIGSMVWSAKKPIEGFPVLTPGMNDQFDVAKLGEQWEWNHQPRAEKWSLSERPGYLRLHAFKSLEGDNLRKVANVISQRVYRARESTVTVKLDLTNLAAGQRAGVCHFARTYSTLGIVQEGTTRTLAFSNNGQMTRGPAITSDTLYLRSTWGAEGVSHYSYSVDGEKFIPFGDAYQLTWGSYRGDRVGVYSYNNTADDGFVDVDWFDHRVSTGAAGR